MCKHNILVVSHEIVGKNRDISLTRPNKSLNWDRKSTLISFIMIHSKLCRYCVLWDQGAFNILKHVSKVKKSYTYTTLKTFSNIRYELYTVALLPISFKLFC